MGPLRGTIKQGGFHMSQSRPRYTQAFKEQIVALPNAGKSMSQLSKEYGPTVTTISRWVHNYHNTGSFKASDNRTEQEKELLELRKRNIELEMENDLLKQAALILGRR